MRNKLGHKGKIHAIFKLDAVLGYWRNSSRYDQALHICAFWWARYWTLDFVGSVIQEGFSKSLVHKQTLKGVGSGLLGSHSSPQPYTHSNQDSCGQAQGDGQPCLHICGRGTGQLGYVSLKASVLLGHSFLIWPDWGAYHQPVWGYLRRRQRRTPIHGFSTDFDDLLWPDCTLCVILTQHCEEAPSTLHIKEWEAFLWVLKYISLFFLCFQIKIRSLFFYFHATWGNLEFSELCHGKLPRAMCT